jgi:hypothetical protein
MVSRGIPVKKHTYPSSTATVGAEQGRRPPERERRRAPPHHLLGRARGRADLGAARRRRPVEGLIWARHGRRLTCWVAVVVDLPTSSRGRAGEEERVGEREAMAGGEVGGGGVGGEEAGANRVRGFGGFVFF